MKKKILLTVLIIIAILIVFTSCKKITQEDIEKQGSRWLVLLCKITESTGNEQAFEQISQAEETLELEFGDGQMHYTEILSSGSLDDKYSILARQNQLLEESLVKIKGQESLKEIQDKYSIEEVPALADKAGSVTAPAGIDSMLDYLFSSPQKKADEELIVVNLNFTEADLIARLKEQGYIKSEQAFKFVLKSEDWQGKINPGGYRVSKAMNSWQLADTLVNYPYQKWIVIPEGLRAGEIAEKLQAQLGLSDSAKDEFLANSREGYLFPDTYLLNLDYSGRDMAKRMENQFNEKTAELFIKATENNILNDTLIVLASIVQREAAGQKDMPMIAGIIWNRWLSDTRFEIDATVQYAVGKQGNWWPILKPDDLKIDSPYNTYIYEGRPPAPICNPGLAAIEAVIYPQESEYFFYLHDSEGQIHPAKTYEEHLENIEKYLK